MPTVLFIHGTGVRGESYFRSVDLIGRKTREFLKGFDFKSCRWGDPYGARLNKEGASIPGYDDSGEASSALEDANIARWHLLGQDPLLELRILPRRSVIGTPPGQKIWKLLEGLPEHPKILPLLQDWSLDVTWAPFMLAVLADDDWKKTIEPITEITAAVSDRVPELIAAAFQIALGSAGYPDSQRRSARR